MTLICKKCGAPIEVKNINVQTMVAGCEVCNAVFTFTTDDLSTTLKGKKLQEQALTGFTVNHNESNTFEVTMRWRKMLGSMEWMVTFLMGMGALFLTPLALTLWSDFFTEFSLNPQSLPLALIATVLSAIAFVCWYILAVIAVDDTHLTLTEDSLSYTYSPIPWQNKHFSRESIAEVELKPVENFENYRELVIITNDGKRHMLDHFQVQYAQYLQRKLQMALFPPADVVENPFALAESDVESGDEAFDNQTHHELHIGDDGEWDIRRANTKSMG